MFASRCRLLLALGLASTTVAAMAVIAAAAPAAVAAPAPGPVTGISEHAACAAVGPMPPGVARCFAIARTPTVAKPMTGGRTVVTPQSASAPMAGSTTPSQVQSLYGLTGRTAAPGTTVAIVTAYDAPNLESDLAQFRQYFSLPPCATANGCFRKVNQAGQLISAGAPAPTADSGWAVETSLDTQAVSSTCPSCNILVVEANSSYISDLGAAVNTAVQLGAKVVSNSYGSPEFSGQASVDSQYFTHPGVALVAASGDNGWLNYGSAIATDRGLANFPATSANVLAVGGTSLTRSTSGALTEQAWSDGGSGCSIVTPRPDWQSAYFAAHNISPDPQCTLPSTGAPARAEVDVSALGDPANGLAVYVQGGWQQIGGTSLSAPLMAGIQALAGTPQPGDVAAAYPYERNAQGLFDVTAGSNQTSTSTCAGTPICTAGTAWDGPTGLGSPREALPLRVPPSAAVHPTTAVPGESVWVSAAGFANNEGITVSSGYTTLAQGAADSSGDVTNIPVTVPTNAVGPSYQLTVTGTNSQLNASTTLSLPPPVVTVAPTSSRVRATVQVSISGFGSGEAVAVTLAPQSSPGSPATSASVTAAADGTGSVAVSVPATGATTLVVQATGASTGRSATTTVAVQPPVLTVTPNSIPAGGSLQVSGSDFVANQSVSLSMSGTVLGTVTTDYTGTFSTHVPVPPGMAIGNQTVSARGTADQASPSAPVTVTAPAPTLQLWGQPPYVASGQLSGSVGNVAANSTVSVLLDGRAIATANTSNSGQTDFTATLPSGLPPGSHTMSAGTATTTISTSLPPATLTMSGTPLAGGTVTLDGTEFQSGERISLNGPVTPNSVSVDSSGALTTSVVISNSAPAGTITVTARGTTSGQSATVLITLPTPVITLSTQTIGVSGALTITGAGFGNGEAVTLAVGASAVASVAAGGAGTFAARVQLPDSVTTGSAVVTATTAARSASTALSITNPFGGDLLRYNGPEHATFTSAPPPGYVLEAQLGQTLQTSQEPNTVLLRECLYGSDYFSSTSANCEGQRPVTALGWIYRSAPSGVNTVPVVRCIASTGDHFDSNDLQCEGQYREEVLGYALATASLARFIGPDHATFVNPVPDYRMEVSLGRVQTVDGGAGTTALYECRIGTDYFTSTIGTCEGQQYVTRLGWVYTASAPGRTAIYRCLAGPEHFDSTSQVCEGQRVEMLLGYTIGHTPLRRLVGADHATMSFAQPPGYSLEESLGDILMQPGQGTVALFECQVGSDYFSSTSTTCEGQRMVGLNGYLYSQPPVGVVVTPVVRCLTSGGDHFDSNDFGCEGQHREGVLGYALAE